MKKLLYSSFFILHSSFLAFAAETLPLDPSEAGRSWAFSIGAGARTGIKLKAKGGAFDLRPTGYVTEDPLDPNFDDGLTTLWGVSSPTQIQGGPGDHSYIGIGGEDLYYMRIETVSASPDATAAIPRFEAALAHALVEGDDYALGFRLFAGGDWGLNKKLRTTAARATHVFSEKVGIAPEPGLDCVEVTPRNVVSGQSTTLTLKGSMWRLGLGPELELWNPDLERGPYLLLHPFVSLNFVSLSMDGEWRDANGALRASTSVRESGMYVGGGITATVAYDLSARWAAGVSVGYEYLPKMELSGNGLGTDVTFQTLTLGTTLLWRF